MGIDHLGLGVPDVDAARDYYDELMPLVGFVREWETGYRATDWYGAQIFLYPAVEDGDYSRHRMGLQHISFHVPTRAETDLVIKADAIAADIEMRELAKQGLCHGARNGWEVAWFAKRLKCSVTGTDISDTAEQVPNMVQHDFHEMRDDWRNRFSFIFTNSLDQAYDPERALNAWIDQLTDDGMIYVEHSMASTPAGACEMDPFGAHPMVMPYLLFQWGKGRYQLEDIKLLDGVEHKRKGKVWVFMIRKWRATS